MMNRMWGRVAMVAFPASALVIIVSAVVEGLTSVDVSNEVAAAATGLLTYAAFVFLGAGEKSEK
jgi:hypothetical protein